MSDSDHTSLNLSPDEKRAFSYLFAQADKDQLGVVTGENAVSFFERTSVSPNVLGEIWQLADTENRGLLTKQGFCIVLRLIGHYQAGREPSPEMALKPGPVPKFEGIQIPGVPAAPSGGSAFPSPTTGAFPPNALQPQLSGQAPIRVPPLDPQKAQQYAGLFERSGAQNALLDGGTAKQIFEKAGLPNEVLGRIWMLSDREQKGALDQTEFIIAMHLLTSMKIRTMTALPNTLPPGLYEAAARRGGPPSRQASGQAAIPRQLTGSNVGAIPRTQSPLARPPGYGTPPPQSAQTTGTPWLITPADKAKFDQYFNNIDTAGRGVITGDQAVSFFSDSRLPEETLAQIWDLSDINSEGQLNKDEFAVAMYLIRQQRAPNAAPLPAFLPPALVPPSMRKVTQQTQQSTAPAFDNAANTSNLPKSAADDLFGLDQPSPPQAQSRMPALQPQGTGTSASRDPFAGSNTPGSPASPTRTQAQQPAGGLFQPIMAKSPFGPSPFSSTTLAQQNTGGSAGSGFGITRGVPQQQQPSPADDLLGDSETSAVESSKITNETTELANMSSQIGNLRTQMEQTQSKKAATQADVTATTNQKRDLELRLQQFRTQYEQEVRAVKELEQQLATSKESTKKLGQELAMLEGTYQDLQTQHQKISQGLQADQQENATLKQRISQINVEVAKLKPEIEKLKMDARQQKGMVSINKKQLATNEGERDRLQNEKGTLETEAAEREEQARNVVVPETTRSPPSGPTSNLASPALSTLSATNPFFRKASNDGAAERSLSSGQAHAGSSTGPSPSAFDTLFGPSAAFAPSGQAGSRAGTPPATSFGSRSIPATSSPAAPAGMTDSIQSVSSVGENTPSATPPLSDKAKDSPAVVEPPPPPASGQFLASHLPVGNVDGHPKDSEASSTMAIPPASRAGEIETSRELRSEPGEPETPYVPGSFMEDPNPTTAAIEEIPGAFPTDTFQESTNGAEAVTPKPSTTEAPGVAQDDFDSAFAGFGNGDKGKEAVEENEDPFASSSSQPIAKPGHSEFPPIQTFEHDDESDSEDEDEKGFDDNFTAASPPKNKAAVTSEHDAPGPSSTTASILINNGGAATAASGVPVPDAQHAPPTYDEANKASHGGERTQENQFGGLLPAREDPTSPPPPEAPSGTNPAVATTSELPAESVKTSSKSVPADEFDEFDDLEDAKPADKNGSDFDFGFAGGRSVTEFDEGFGSPARTGTAASSQQTPVPATRSLHQSTTNGFADFEPTVSTSSTFDTQHTGNSSLQQTPQNVQHDWDAIFSGLDSSKGPDTSLATNDPWGSAAPTNGGGSSSTAAQSVGPPPAIPQSKPERGGAITPGTEHDDPILKRLTGMGYPRKDALDALEKYDYDINRAVDHLTTS